MRDKLTKGKKIETDEDRYAQIQKNKKVQIVVSLIEALYPDNCLMVSKDKQEIVIKNGDEGLIIPFESCRTMRWEVISRQVAEFMRID